MREAYRLTKQPLESLLLLNEQKLSLFWIYSDKSIRSFDDIKKACEAILNKLMRQLSSTKPVEKSTVNANDQGRHVDLNSNTKTNEAAE